MNTLTIMSGIIIFLLFAIIYGMDHIFKALEELRKQIIDKEV